MDKYVETCVEAPDYNGTLYYYAEHAFPGLTVADLARVTAVVKYTYLVPPAPMGATHSTAPVWLADERAVVYCASGPPPLFSEVTFIYPHIDQPP